MNVLKFARLLRVVATELESWSEDDAPADIPVKPEPKKSTKKTTRKQVKPAAEESEPPEAANEAQEEAVTIDAVKRCLQDILSASGQNAALDLLNEFGAKKMTDLAEDTFADFVVAAQKLVG